MTKTLVVICSVLFLVSCRYDNTPYYEGLIGLPEVSSVNEAWRISSSMRYVPDNKQSCKEPNDTYIDGYGDCEDIAALMLGLIEYSNLGTGKLVIVYTDTPRVLHALVYFKGVYYEAQCLNWYVFNPRVKEYWDLTHYMRLRNVYNDFILE